MYLITVLPLVSSQVLPTFPSPHLLSLFRKQQQTNKSPNKEKQEKHIHVSETHRSAE